MTLLAEAFDLADSFFVDTGPFAREHYAKHLEAMAATKHYKRCTIFGANRVGKSLGWCYALACFLTGKYPHWWDGRVFNHAVNAWAAGVSSTQVRDSLQRYLFGTREQPGGFVRASDIHAVSWGKDGCLERVVVKHTSGGLSQCEFKTYAMNQERFQSATLHVALMDEEPKAGIYSEAVTRTATTGGLVLTGFTALKGVTPLIAHLLPEFADGEPTSPEESGHWYTFIGWDDIPYAHLSKRDRADTMAGYLSHEIDARTKGIPRLGSGKVWPVDERQFIIPNFDPPAHWPRIAAIDPGYQDPTGILHGAYDMENDALYLYGEYRQNLQHIAIHADVVHKKGDWIPCVIDPAGANQTDGERVYTAWSNALKNPCFKAEKGLTKGLQEVYDRMLDGRFFVMDTLKDWRGEYATYSRDERGRIMDQTEKHHFDLMACFVRGTPIETPEGQRDVATLRAGDVVGTVNGPRQVVAAWETGLREVWELSMSDGRKLIGTGDHPVWVEGKGFIHLNALRYGDKLHAWPRKCALASKSSTTACRTIGTRTASRLLTAITITTLNAASSFIARCGKMRMDRYLKAITSTISTAISSITESRTLLACPPLSTSGTTTKGIVPTSNALISAGSGRLFPNGISQRQGNEPTQNSPQNPPSCERSRKFSTVRAITAAKRTASSTLARIASAIPIAEQPLSVVGVKKLSKPERVYNIQVDETPEYFAGGIRVHNCTRYLVMGLKHAKQKPLNWRSGHDHMRNYTGEPVNTSLSAGLWS